PRLPSKQSVVWVDVAQVRARSRGLPVRGAGQDEPVKVFEGPTPCRRIGGRPGQLAGEPVEQLRVRGRTPLGAEIVLRLDDSLAELLLPNPHHYHTGGQWFVR